MNIRGYHLDRKECTVLGWSGLRGAVGLALGLQIYGDTEIHDEEFRTKQFFHIGCVAVLTILLQGSTMKLLLHVSLCRLLILLKILLSRVSPEVCLSLSFSTSPKVRHNTCHCGLPALPGLTLAHEPGSSLPSGLELVSVGDTTTFKDSISCVYKDKPAVLVVI